MNNAQKFIYWLDRKSPVFEKIELARANWFESKFPLKEWFKNCQCILDIGAGVCDITAKMKKYTEGTVVGVDVEDFRRNGNKSSTMFEYCMADAKFLPFKEKSLDCVTVLWTLHHIGNPIKVLDEIDRILTPNGRLIILEDLVDNKLGFRGYFTRIYDKIINLEYASHPHSNMSLDGWNMMIKNKYGYTPVELLEIPWFTKYHLLKFGLLRYVK
ncbi:MAG: methyltransferase domain-containing protein [Ignavibacteriaceae bacterium]|nr:methyltransferase domain-containing protein [Ignavibacteriaceae bacterium]